MPRKSRPWAVQLTTADPNKRTEHTSQAKTYAHVREITAAVRAGQSDVTRIRVEQWDQHGQRWQLFDVIDPHS